MYVYTYICVYVYAHVYVITHIYVYTHIYTSRIFLIYIIILDYVPCDHIIPRACALILYHHTERQRARVGERERTRD